MTRTCIVVPCYEEAQRLSLDVFRSFLAEQADIDFVFVDDGSRDATLERLRAFAKESPERVQVLALPLNRGKAEAVRLGMRAAFERGAAFAGYWDADLATPLWEISRFEEELSSHPECALVLGARVNLHGRSIVRSPVRHYAGRVFATLASWTLGLAIYDTQCGAKLLRVDDETRALFDEPFETSWVFDVELIARLVRARRAAAALAAEGPVLRELPLRQWHDVPGSKVRPLDFLWSLAGLARIWAGMRSA